MPKEFSGKIDSCIIKIYNKSVKGNGITKYKGYTKSEISYTIDGLQGEQLKNRITNMLKRGNHSREIL